MFDFAVAAFLRLSCGGFECSINLRFRFFFQIGVCSDPSELVNDILRSLAEQQRAALPVTPELENWLLSAADKPACLLLKEDFGGICERVRARIGSSCS